MSSANLSVAPLADDIRAASISRMGEGEGGRGGKPICQCANVVALFCCAVALLNFCDCEPARPRRGVMAHGARAGCSVTWEIRHSETLKTAFMYLFSETLKTAFMYI